MSVAGISGMRAAGGDLIDVARSLSEGEMADPQCSGGLVGCRTWSVTWDVYWSCWQAAVSGEAIPDSGN